MFRLKAIHINCAKDRAKILIKGMIPMRFAKDTLVLADRLVVHYAKFDLHSNCYVIIFDHIHDIHLQELAASIMQNDYIYAGEATGPDNDSYNDSMLPSLIKFLNDESFDSKCDFIEAWKKGTTNYFLPAMKKLMQERLDDYNEQKNHSKGDDDIWAA